MNKILFFLLCTLPILAFGQSTTVLPTPTTSFTPQFRYYGTAADTLKQVWVFTGSKYNRWYTATEINARYGTSFKNQIDSLKLTPGTWGPINFKGTGGYQTVTNINGSNISFFKTAGDYVGSLGYDESSNSVYFQFPFNSPIKMNNRVSGNVAVNNDEFVTKGQLLDSLGAAGGDFIQNQNATTQTAKFKINGAGQASQFIVGDPDAGNYGLLDPGSIEINNPNGSALLSTGGFGISNTLVGHVGGFSVTVDHDKVAMDNHTIGTAKPFEVDWLQSTHAPSVDNDVMRKRDVDSTYIRKDSVIKNQSSTSQTASFRINGKGWLTDGTVNVSGNDTTTIPSILSTKPQILIAKTIDATSTVAWHGYADNSFANWTVTNGSYNNFDAFGRFSSANSTDHILAAQSRNQWLGPGTLNLFQGYRDAPFISGPVNFRYGLRLSNPTLSGGGTLSDNYAIYIEGQTSGSNSNYGIYGPSANVSTLIGGKTTTGSLTISGTPSASSDVAQVFMTRDAATGDIKNTNKVVSTDPAFGVSSTGFTGDMFTGLVRTSIAAIGAGATNKPFASTGGALTLSTSSTVNNHIAFDRVGTSLAWNYNSSAWITLTGTAGQTYTLPTATSTLYGTGTGTITSSQLATSLTDEIGTGSVVFSASPTLTGTPTAPTAAATTLTTQIATTAFAGAFQNYTASGTGAATTIVIPHGLTGISGTSKVIVQPLNAASAGVSYVTIDATSVSVVYTVAPANGTNNLNYSIHIKP